MTDDEIQRTQQEIEIQSQQDPEATVPTQVANQVDTQRMLGDLQLQQQMQQQQMMPQEQQPEQKKKPEAKK